MTAVESYLELHAEMEAAEKRGELSNATAALVELDDLWSELTKAEREAVTRGLEARGLTARMEGS